MAGITSLTVGGDLIAAVQAAGTIQALSVGGTFKLPDNPVYFVGGRPALALLLGAFGGSIGTVTVGGDLGTNALVQRGIVAASQNIKLVRVGTGGKGNLYASVWTYGGDINTVEVKNGAIAKAEVLAIGNIGVVRAGVIDGSSIKARLTLFSNPGAGNIGLVEAGQASGSITADVFLGDIVLTGANPSRVFIQAQSGALFNDDGSLFTDDAGDPLQWSLDVVSQNAVFRGQIKFGYRDNLIESQRIEFAPGADLLDFTMNPKKGQDSQTHVVWTVARQQGTDESVWIKNAVFQVQPVKVQNFPMPQQQLVLQSSEFVNPDTGEATNAWAIIPPP